MPQIPELKHQIDELALRLVMGDAESVGEASCVQAIEEIRVPAGAFRAFRVAGEGESWTGTGQTLLKRIGWIDPATMLEIRYELKFLLMTGPRVRPTEDSTTELVRMDRVPR